MRSRPTASRAISLTRRLLLLSLTKSIVLAPTICSAVEKTAHNANVQTISKAQPTETPFLTFTAPPWWRFADAKALPPSVKIMVVGQGKGPFPPSINLGVEEYNGTLKQYLKTIKAINDSQGSQWQELGTLHTGAGEGSLSQVISKTEWGEVRMMHVVVKCGELVCIVTAAAKKDEFSDYYKVFFDAMKSLRIAATPLELINDPIKAMSLKQRLAAMQLAWNALLKSQENKSKEQLFDEEAFQKNQWKPFQTALLLDFADMGEGWQQQLTFYAKRQLFENKEKPLL